MFRSSKNVFCRKSKKDGVVTFVDGAQIKDVSFCDLYNAKKINTTTDTSVERFVKDYFIKPRSKYEMVEAGISVDLDIPKGDTDSDKAIRKWMISAIRDDAFFLLENNKDIPVGKCTSLNDMLHSLDEYGVLWEKLCRAENQIEDTLDVRMTCDIRVKKVADCDDYTTYHYWASLYNGGLHELPREYYITYDKRRGGLLDVNNTVKSSMLQHFRQLVLESLKKEYDFSMNKKVHGRILHITYFLSIVLLLVLKKRIILCLRYLIVIILVMNGQAGMGTTKRHLQRKTFL